MARPRKQTYSMKQYLDNEEDGYISNSFSTQRNPKWKSIIDGLVVTILTDDYIPPIILAEDQTGKTVIVDGGSRTAAFKMFCKGNYKIKSSVEDHNVKYKKMEKDENGNPIWSDDEFDISCKTFDQLPKELQKKFFEYQVETVIHECNEEQAAKYLRRYNEHTAMNANEKMFLYLTNFADTVRKIIDKEFFIECSSFTENEKDKGVLERVISEAIMCMFHLDKWNKNSKKNAMYLNNNATNKEFEKLNENISRLEKIITDDTKELFNSKNAFIWIALFNKFTELNIEDSEFNKFLQKFKSEFSKKEVNGKTFDDIDKGRGTKDRNIITDKLEMLESFMYEYFGIDMENTAKEVGSKDTETQNDIIDFVRANVNKSLDHEDISLYEDMFMDLAVNVDNNSVLMDEENRPSFIAMIGYSFEKDIDLEDWIVDFFERNHTYRMNQTDNFNIMKRDLTNWLHKNGKKIA